MQKQFFIIMSLWVAISGFAQNSGMNYKALITNNNNVLSNHNLTIRFTILQNGSTSVYQETQTATTNANGIVAVNVGEGTVVSGNFDNIDWGADAYYLKVEINTGSGYTNFGTSEFKYVPYAKYADEAGNTFSGNYNDLSNKPLVFTRKGTVNSPAISQNDSIVHSGKVFLGITDNVTIYNNVIHSPLTIGNNLQNEIIAGKIYETTDANHAKSFGDINVLTGNGRTDKVGAYQFITGNSSSGSFYGNITSILESGQGDRFGSYNQLSGNGSGNKFGIYNSIQGNGTGMYFGIYNELKEGKSQIIGVYNKIQSAENQEHYGTLNVFQVNSSRNQFGIYNDIYNDGSGDCYASYNNISGGGNGDKYAVYAVVDKTAPGTHYAVYGKSIKTGSFAGYFKGQMYVSDKIGVGITNPTGKIQTIPAGNLNDGGNFNYDNAGLIIGSTSDGISFDANQIERTGGTLYINYLSDADMDLCNGGGNVKIHNKLIAPASGNADMKAYVYGRINDQGSIQTNGSSNGFTAQRLSVGKYKITFSDNSINTNYSVTATINSNSAYIITVQTITDFFYVNIFDRYGNRQNSDFNFTVYRKN
jgi:hypothetical protein